MMFTGEWEVWEVKKNRVHYIRIEKDKAKKKNRRRKKLAKQSKKRNRK